MNQKIKDLLQIFQIELEKLEKELKSKKLIDVEDIGPDIINNLQEKAYETAIYPRSQYLNVNYPTLGLCAEVGELANHIKKIYRVDNGKIEPSRLKLIKDELGDVWWYLNVLAKELGLRMSDVIENNLKKVKKQYGQEAKNLKWGID